MRAGPLLAIKNVSKIFFSPAGEVPALNDINLNIYTGEFISIVGPSGCGKSTLLNIIAGLIAPSKGQVFINGLEVTGPSGAVGYMPQGDHLFNWRTIWRNVLLGLEVQNKVNDETKAFAYKLLQTYGLADFKHYYPAQLSGGMKQRIALIRTLATNPDILLLDEAFSALDYQTRLLISDEVKDIIRKERKTAILVTHDIAEAISMADRVAVLSNRPGTVQKIYPINLTCAENTPIKCREAPEFREYFNRIWKELNIHG